MFNGNTAVNGFDEDGRFFLIAVAVISGTINVVLHAKQIHSFTDFAVAFGIGAVAGVVGAATGGAAFAAAGGAAAGVGGFLAGSAGGMVGSAFAMPIQNLGNNAYFGDPLMTPKQYALGVLSAGVTAGALNGITALTYGRSFWTGSYATPSTPLVAPALSAVDEASLPRPEVRANVEEARGLVSGNKAGLTPAPPRPTLREAPTTSDGIKIPSDRSILEHIFKESNGHVNPSTISSKKRFLKLFQYVASRRVNLNNSLLDTRAVQSGFKMYVQNFNSGKVWVIIRPNGTIHNAGVNSWIHGW